jgi:hypothetical protein
MRNWSDWSTPLIEELHALLADSPIALDKSQCRRLFEVELVIALYELVAASNPTFQAAPFPLTETWSLLTGYITPELKDDPKLVQAALMVRCRCNYIRTRTAWNHALAWYKTLPEVVRNYQISSDESYTCVTSPYVPQRRRVMADALGNVPDHKEPTIRLAKPGKEYFFYNGSEYVGVTIPSDAINGMKTILSQTPPVAPSPPRNTTASPPPIQVDVDELGNTALALHRQFPDQDWLQRFENLRKSFRPLSSTSTNNPSVLEINGLFHLLGPTGSGKSTFLTLLITNLCQRDPNFRIAVIANTVTDALDLCSELIQTGISAAPILGKDRETHQSQYGMAHRQQLDPGILFDLNSPEINEPALKWLTGVCPLAAYSTGDIPPGHEPCRRLVTTKNFQRIQKDYRTTPTYYSCPLMPVCPVHQSGRDLTTAQVWVATPASLVFTTMPTDLVKTRMSALEAIYHWCHLVIVDEVDRVQLSVEERFTPTNDLCGTPKSLIDSINLQLAELSYRNGKMLLADKRFRDLSFTAQEANRLCERLFSLILDYPHLKEWANRPIYNTIAYEHILSELENLYPQIPQEQLLSQLAHLKEIFKQFHREFPSAGISFSPANQLEQIVCNVLNQGGRLILALQNWIEPLLPAPLPTTESTQVLLEKLAFAVILSGVDKLVNDLTRYWLNNAPELNPEPTFANTVPQEFADIGIESPLGNLLGYQFIEQPALSTNQPVQGTLRHLNCLNLGRFLLLRLPYLYLPLTGQYGPHTLLTSATSWAPESPSFHLSIPPDAVLVPSQKRQDAIRNSHFSMLAVPDISGKKIHVSGSGIGSNRYEALTNLIRYLALDQGNQRSHLENELAHWKETGRARGILLLTGSYSEARHISDFLQSFHQWKGRIKCLQSDRTIAQEEWILARSLVEELPYHNADVLVSPLPSIQRAYNILDPVTKTAFLGSIYFLVRPYPNSTDVSRHLRAINKWAIDTYLSSDEIRPFLDGGNAPTAIGKLRKTARARWYTALQTSGFESAVLNPQQWQQICWDQIVALTQVLGRACRGDVEMHVFFCDAAFFPESPERHLLLGWRDILAPYFQADSSLPDLDRELASILYGAVYDQLTRMLK